ncbi:MAG: acyltransferase [Candidatus Woesearchaeota archaeon]
MIKEIIKAIMSVICFVLLIPLFILYRIRIFAFLSSSQLLSLIPGFFGIMLRRVWYKCTLAECGKNFTVDFMGVMRTPKSKVGNDVYVGVNTFVGWADIGDDTMLSGYVLVLSGGAQHGTTRLDIPMRLQEGKVEHIIIGKDCWIGAGSIILTDIADNSVVGSGSVVTKKFSQFDIIAGVPAKKIKSRKNQE